LKSEEFEQIIKKKQALLPAYVFAGNEPFLKEQALQSLLSNYVAPENRAANHIRISSDNLSALFGELNVFSFNSDMRFLYLSDFSEAKAADRKNLLKSLSDSQIPSNTCILFEVSNSRHAKEIESALKRQSDQVDFWKPFANKLPAWVKEQASRLGTAISTEAAELLLELTGTSLPVIYSELVKLSAGKKKAQISLEDVKKQVSYSKEDNVFDFLNTVGDRDTGKSLRILQKLLQSGEAPQMVWFMLVKRLRLIRLFLSLEADRPDLLAPVSQLLKRYSRIADKEDWASNNQKREIVKEIQEISAHLPQKISDSLGLTNSLQIRNLSQAVNFSLSEALRFSEMMVETDLKMKGAADDPERTLSLFIADITLEQH